MALFTDGPINTIADLQNYENGILSVANTEGLDLTGKIALAQKAIATELVLFVLRRLPPWNEHVVTQRAIGVNDVVVTEPLRQWHAHQSLALIYRDAYNNQLNGRYQGKWNEYEALAKRSSRTYFQAGVGLVTSPIAKASIPTLTAVAGAGAAGTYYVVVTWANQAGQQGTPSDVAEFTTADGQQLVVTHASAPANVQGWNAYVGTTPSTMSLQNTAPLAIGSSWSMTSALRDGVRPSAGQEPEWFLVDQRLIERG